MDQPLPTTVPPCPVPRSICPSPPPNPFPPRKAALPRLPSRFGLQIWVRQGFPTVLRLGSCSSAASWALWASSLRTDKVHRRVRGVLPRGNGSKRCGGCRRRCLRSWVKGGCPSSMMVHVTMWFQPGPKPRGGSWRPRITSAIIRHPKTGGPGSWWRNSSLSAL